MKKKNSLLVVGASLAVAVTWAGTKASRAGYEGPEYDVVSKSGKFEIRRYAGMVGASTAMANRSGQRNNGFGRLFQYITGANETEEKIAMTSPVFVETDNQANEEAMIFVMPKKTVSGGVPKPTSQAVEVKRMSGGEFAVLRFKGSNSKEAQKGALERLRELIGEQGLRAQGEPVYAYYDPPWTPEFLRRNEVMLRVTGVKGR